MGLQSMLNDNGQTDTFDYNAMVRDIQQFHDLPEDETKSLMLLVNSMLQHALAVSDLLNRADRDPDAYRGAGNKRWQGDFLPKARNDRGGIWGALLGAAVPFLVKTVGRLIWDKIRGRGLEEAGVRDGGYFETCENVQSLFPGVPGINLNPQYVLNRMYNQNPFMMRYAYYRDKDPQLKTRQTLLYIHSFDDKTDYDRGGALTQRKGLRKRKPTASVVPAPNSNNCNDDDANDNKPPQLPKQRCLPALEKRKL